MDSRGGCKSSVCGEHPSGLPDQTPAKKIAGASADRKTEFAKIMPAIEILPADLSVPPHQEAVVSLLNAYAADPMGDGKALPPEVLERLVAGLREHPTTLILLALSEAKPIGIAACFRGFSTFAAKPLMNIHDLYVAPEMRGRGVGRLLLDRVESEALRLGCCKLTLEVQEGNARAQQVYRDNGFSQSTYVLEAGGALFLSKLVG